MSYNYQNLTDNKQNTIAKWNYCHQCQTYFFTRHPNTSNHPHYLPPKRSTSFQEPSSFSYPYGIKVVRSYSLYNTNQTYGNSQKSFICNRPDICGKIYKRVNSFTSSSGSFFLNKKSDSFNDNQVKMDSFNSKKSQEENQGGSFFLNVPTHVSEDGSSIKGKHKKQNEHNHQTQSQLQPNLNYLRCKENNSDKCDLDNNEEEEESVLQSPCSQSVTSKLEFCPLPPESELTHIPIKEELNSRSGFGLGYSLHALGLGVFNFWDLQ